MPTKPWYEIVTPREDLREGKPLATSEFAVHLDQVREGRAPADYQKPERFFERTYLTKYVATLARAILGLILMCWLCANRAMSASWKGVTAMMKRRFHLSFSLTPLEGGADFVCMSCADGV